MQGLRMDHVAVIGTGPGGLVAARYLASEGFEPVLFEQGGTIGGQWSGDRSRSGVWPSMRTNTSRVLTAFSDRPHPPGAQVYPTNQAIRRYLQDYADAFDLTPRIHLNTPVSGLRRSADRRGWMLTTAQGERWFSRVVVASGAFHRWTLPAVPGVDAFSGACGVAHTYAYDDPEKYRGRRVLVAGGAISALEIASDLAMLGAEQVTLAARRHRFVLPKLAAGTPTDHTVFTRALALAEERLDAEEVNRLYTELALRLGGNPAHYGAPASGATVAEAGLTLCQHFLPLVAEGRIEVRPWLVQADGRTIRFADGRSDEFDVVLFGTGFDFHLPFLSPAIRSTLDLDTQHIDLHNRTFHPDLPGLAFVGFWDQSGPYFPPLELQARWIAYAWSGAVPAPTGDEMRAGVQAYRARRGRPQKTRMSVAALQFARAAGVEPRLERWPHLAAALLFGPLTAVSFRLDGHDASADAPRRVAEEAQAFGCISETLTPAQCAQLRALTAIDSDAVLTALAQGPGGAGGGAVDRALEPAGG
jgi:dimethylaniline monooxygenase (N-oxide forming)